VRKETERSHGRRATLLPVAVTETAALFAPKKQVHGVELKLCLPERLPPVAFGAE
jgi:hypothetical protein